MQFQDLSKLSVSQKNEFQMVNFNQYCIINHITSIISITFFHSDVFFLAAKYIKYIYTYIYIYFLAAPGFGKWGLCGRGGELLGKYFS